MLKMLVARKQKTLWCKCVDDASITILSPAAYILKTRVYCFYKKKIIICVIANRIGFPRKARKKSNCPRLKIDPHRNKKTNETYVKYNNL